MHKDAVYTDKVFPPTGPYSQAVRMSEAKTLIYTSSVVALDTEWNVIGVGDVEAQTRKTLENLVAILAEAGATLDNVIKMTVYLTDITLMPQVAKVRSEFFKAPFPASTTVPINALALPELLLEIDVVAAS